MKKTITILAIGISIISFAQQFVLTPENFKNISDKSKDFVVIEFPGQNQKQIFDKAKMYIHSNFNNLKGDGYNEVEFSQIKLRASIIANAGKTLGFTVTIPYSTVYELGFKDGKIMIRPFFEEAERQDKYNTKIYLTGGSGVLGKSIFKKDGSVWMPDFHSGVEESTNDFVAGLKDAINKSEDW